MPTGLKRYYGARHLHFITSSCYRRLPLLRTARARDRFLRILESVRQAHRFVVVGYVVMPEHIHLLISEPAAGTPSTIMQVLKQRVARALRPRRRHSAQSCLFPSETRPRSFWQARFYDFNVWSERKRIEKLNYMHANPVKRGLVASPEQWRWSSYRWYAYGEKGPLALETWTELERAMKAAAG